MLYELSGSAADSKDIRLAEVKSEPGITPIYFGTHSKAVKITIKSVKGNQTAIQYHKGSNCLVVNPSGQMPFSQCVCFGFEGSLSSAQGELNFAFQTDTV